jgi:hypothetical protein
MLPGTTRRGGIKTMDHELVVREKMTEKYLLSELDGELRDEFEEHFFDCQECARDIRAGSAFIEQSKIILAGKPETASVAASSPRPKPANGSWFGWLRPAFVLPALAILLVVVGYQNAVVLPKLTDAMNRPQLLPAATVNLLTYGANTSPLVVHAGEGFLLNVIIPPGHAYPAYRVDMYNPAGKMEASVPIPALADDTWPIRFPAINRQSGTYKVTVHGVTPDGKDVEVGSSSFELQVQR